MEMATLDEVLRMHDISHDEWAFIKDMPTFQTLFKRCVSEWATATNTKDRVALKSLAIVEESLPEFYARMHDPRESLSAKTEVLKAISRFAGVGITGADVGGGERLTVTINLGADQKIQITKDVTPPGNGAGNSVEVADAEEVEDAGEELEEADGGSAPPVDWATPVAPPQFGSPKEWHFDLNADLDYDEGISGGA
jgi:hypothetical protein